MRVVRLFLRLIYVNKLSKTRAVNVQVLVSSNVTETFPTSVETLMPEALLILPSIVPSKFELELRFMVRVESRL